MAQRCFERAFYIWQELIRDDPTWLYPDNLFPAAIDMRWLVINSGQSEDEVPRRFERIRERLARMGAGQEGDLILGLLRVGYLCPKAERVLPGQTAGAGAGCGTRSRFRARRITRATFPSGKLPLASGLQLPSGQYVAASGTSSRGSAGAFRTGQPCVTEIGPRRPTRPPDSLRP